MEWTQSAPQGDIFASSAQAAGATTGVRQLNPGMLGLIGAGDPSRGALVGATGLLIATGVAISALDTHLMTAVFFLAAALAALAALMRERIVTVSAEPALHVVRESAAAVVRAEAVTANSAARAAVDSARWQKLTAHMSHELRTPLNAVLGFSELMSHEVFGPMGARCYSDYAHSIHASGHQLLKSAEDALALTALLTAPDGRHSPQTACCKDAVAQAVEFLTKSEPGQRVTFQHAGLAAGLAQTDRQTLRQLFINVACDLSRDLAAGATMTFTSRTLNGVIELSIASHGDRVAATGPTAADSCSLVAHTLADLSGAHLTMTQLADGMTSATIRIAGANQADLFTA